MTTPHTLLDVHLRWVCAKDIPDMIAIEKNTYSVSGWEREQFKAIISEKNAFGYVAQYKDRCVGYLIASLDAKNIEVLNLTIAQEFQRKGIGSRLIARMQEKLVAHAREKITLTVRDGNLPVQCFLRKLGFVAVNLFKHHYRDTGEDGYEFKYYNPELKSENDLPSRKPVA